jgi:hypothetical protein
MNDLSLGFNRAERYFMAGQNMPLFLQRYLPYRMFRFLASGQPKNPIMARIYQFWKNPGRKLFLMAALTARDTTLSQIAELCATTPAVILMFSRLCWNIRLHWNDRAFMVEHLQRHTLQSGPISPELALLRTADTDGLPGILKVLRMDNQRQTPTEYLWQLGQEAGQEALNGVLQGRFSEENNQALALLRTIAAPGSGEEGTHQNQAPRDVLMDASRSLDLSTRYLKDADASLKKRLEAQMGQNPETAKPSQE